MSNLTPEPISWAAVCGAVGADELVAVVAIGVVVGLTVGGVAIAALLLP